MLINRKALIEKIDAKIGENNAALERAIADGRSILAGQLTKATDALQWVIDAIDEMHDDGATHTIVTTIKGHKVAESKVKGCGS